MSTDLDRKPTPEELHQLWDPLVKHLIARHGKERAKRMFVKAVENAGFDPDEVRVVFAEDLS